jgi:hypothetical protein
VTQQPIRTTGLPADLPACFDHFKTSAVRAETLPVYNVPDEAAARRAFELGLPLPERSLRTSPWLRRIQTTTAARMIWTRIRIIRWPLTPYQLFQFKYGYPPSKDAGENIWVADATAHPELDGIKDGWLFDAMTDHPFAALMNYDETGAYLGAEVTDDPRVTDRLADQMRLAAHCSVPLGTFLRRRLA